MIVFNDLDVAVERDGGIFADIREHGLDFTLEVGLPNWCYAIDGVVIEKSIIVLAHKNIVQATFRLLGNDSGACLRLRPFINFRPLEASANRPLARNYALNISPAKSARNLR
jgi:glycogen debranching enzyme-like protein